MIIRSISVVSLLFSHLSSASSSRRKGGGGESKWPSSMLIGRHHPRPSHTPLWRGCRRGPPSSEIWKNLEPLGEDFFFLEYEYEQVDKTKMFCVNFRWGFRGCGGGGWRTLPRFWIYLQISGRLTNWNVSRVNVVFGLNKNVQILLHLRGKNFSKARKCWCVLLGGAKLAWRVSALPHFWILDGIRWKVGCCSMETDWLQNSSS